MTKDTGGQAFPRPYSTMTQAGTTYHEPCYDGMTLRDYFAGQALMGIVANPRSPAPCWDRCANHAYELADAMIAERSKP